MLGINLGDHVEYLFRELDGCMAHIYIITKDGKGFRYGSPEHNEHNNLKTTEELEGTAMITGYISDGSAIMLKAVDPPYTYYDFDCSNEVIVMRKFNHNDMEFRKYDIRENKLERTVTPRHPLREACNI